MLVVTTQPHAHRHPHALGTDEDLTSRIRRLSMFLESHFGDIELHTGHDLDPKPEHEGLSNGPRLIIKVDGTDACVDLLTLVSTVIKSSSTLEVEIEPYVRRSRALKSH